MKRSMLIGALLLIVLVVPGIAQTTMPATSQPAVATQPVRSLIRIQMEIGMVWEEISDLVDTPDWRYADLTKLVSKLVPLFREQHERMSQITGKLRQRTEERAKESSAFLEELDRTPILTPAEEKEFEKWLDEGKKEKNETKK